MRSQPLSFDRSGGAAKRSAWRCLKRCIGLVLMILTAFVLPSATAQAQSPPAAPNNLTLFNYPIPTSIRIVWTDRSTNEDSFTVERQMEGESDFLPITSVSAANGIGTNVSFTDTGLPYDTPVTYRVKAVNAYGSSGYTNTVNGTTAPLAPINLTASSVPGTDNQIQLTWTDSSRYETSFYIFRRNPGSTTFNVITSVTGVAGTGGSVTYTDTGLNSNATFEYYVTAVNSAGQSPESNYAAGTTNATLTVPLV